MINVTQNSVDIGLSTNNINDMKKFYIDVLGCTEVVTTEIPGDFIEQAGFGGNNLRLHALKFGDILIKLLDFENKPSGNDQKLADSQIGFRYLTFWVENMEETVAHLKKNNVDLQCQILSRVPERKLVFFKDPDGNLLELNWIDPNRV
ncbi:MAG: VOC family protein [Nitrospinota bacterium]|nr:VOC family protein [Nitrospinota bacterium]